MIMVLNTGTEWDGIGYLTVIFLESLFVDNIYFYKI
jgi:hypothetical protein